MFLDNQDLKTIKYSNYFGSYTDKSLIQDYYFSLSIFKAGLQYF